MDSWFTLIHCYWYFVVWWRLLAIKAWSRLDYPSISILLESLEVLFRNTVNCWGKVKSNHFLLWLIILQCIITIKKWLYYDGFLLNHYFDHQSAESFHFIYYPINWVICQQMLYHCWNLCTIDLLILTLKVMSK